MKVSVTVTGSSDSELSKLVSELKATVESDSFTETLNTEIAKELKAAGLPDAKSEDESHDKFSGKAVFFMMNALVMIALALFL